MEAMGIGECEKCSRLYFPGDEVFIHRGKTLCALCHSCSQTRFAGLILCH